MDEIDEIKWDCIEWTPKVGTPSDWKKVRNFNVRGDLETQQRDGDLSKVNYGRSEVYH